MENKKIHPLYAAHMEPSKEMLGLTALETAKHWNEPTEPYKWSELRKEDLQDTIEKILKECEKDSKFSPAFNESIKHPEFEKAIRKMAGFEEDQVFDDWQKFNDNIEQKLWNKNNIEKEYPRALTATQKMKQKHFDRKKQLEMNEEIQDRFEAAGIIHNEHRNMAIPGALPPQAVLYLNPILPMIIEGKMQEKLWDIQGVKK